MRITITRDDGFVYNEGRSYSGLDLSCVPANVHALQFDNTSKKGWIEFINIDENNKPANESITSLPEWANLALVKWDEGRIASIAAIEAAINQPQTQGIQPA